MDELGDLFNMLQGLIINIPTDNALGVIYVVFNIILLVLGTILQIDEWTE